MENTFKAQIKGNASEQVFTKSNGGEYVLIQCLITEGPLKGQVVSGTRTIKNAEGSVKTIPAIGDSVTLYHRAMPSTTGSGLKHFFEISTGVLSASDDEITALLNLGAAPAPDNALTALVSANDALASQATGN